MRNNIDRFILFKKALRDVENMYRDIGAYDMKYSEFKEMCRKAWSEKPNYVHIDKTKNKKKAQYLIFKENKNT